MTAEPHRPGLDRPADWIEGRFVSRESRFRVTVAIKGRQVWAHLPNSGRLGELLVPGRRVLLREREGARRKTGYDMGLVEMDGRWISVDARLPNDLVEEALRADALEPLRGYASLRREVTYGRSRFDLRLEGPDRPPCLVEVKSITLVLDGLGCFPDAVTERGRRHLLELAAAVGEGLRAAVVFCIQRDDARGMRPHDEADPAFGRALRQAAAGGVEVYAYTCRVEPERIELVHRVPVHLDSRHHTTD
ncbi:MAG: DNA/RNA nuclease SfsA [Anaerolineae bacterium]|nr:DNA/RNA nuclease SfsA [Anaerolineae bacterium]